MIELIVFENEYLLRSTSKTTNKIPKDVVEDEEIRICGDGLKGGEVGIASSFQVYTPNNNKGPLSVSITCPAMSIPVPSVTSSFHMSYMKFDVIYLPTEPGVYQFDVTWGKEPLPGSPFFTCVSETKKTKQNIVNVAKESERGENMDDVKMEGVEMERLREEETKDSKEEKMVENPNEAMISYYRPSIEHNLVMYYSATTRDPFATSNKTYLEGILRECNPLEGSLLCVTIDLEVEKLYRNKIFEKASSRTLPMVFLNQKFVGSYQDVVKWYSKGQLARVLLKYAGIDDTELL